MENAFGYINKFAPDPIFFDPIPVTDPLPPLWLGPPIKDFANPPKDNGGGNGGGNDVPDPIRFPPQFRTYAYTGQVRDAVTELPLPGATVRLLDDGAILMQQVADHNGNFSISLNMPADEIAITEVSHKGWKWPASEVQHTFDLEPNIKDIEPVLLPPGTKKKNYQWVAIGLLALFIAKEEKMI